MNRRSEPAAAGRPGAYTRASAATVTAAVVLDLAVVRTRLLTRRSFWTAYAIVLAGQLVANGVLTGRGVVRYDERRILGPRLARAPVEDLGFGFGLVTATLVGWVALGRRRPAPGPARQPPAGAAAAR